MNIPLSTMALLQNGSYQLPSAPSPTDLSMIGAEQSLSPASLGLTSPYPSSNPSSTALGSLINQLGQAPQAAQQPSAGMNAPLAQSMNGGDSVVSSVYSMY